MRPAGPAQADGLLGVHGVTRREVERWVAQAAEEIVAHLGDGLELVEVTFKPEGRRLVLRVTIDREGGVSLDHCEAVSHALSDRLDAHDPIPQQYHLEVSSPGLDRPLVRESDYERFAGRTVRLSTYAPIDGRRNWEGQLLGLSDGNVRLLVDRREVAIPYDGIARCRLVPQF